MAWFKRAWRGEERLWKVFWIYGFLIGTIFKNSHYLLNILEGMAGYSFTLYVYYALQVVYLIWFLWLTVSTWRCAFNVDWRIWGYIVRLLTLLSIILMLYFCVVMGKEFYQLPLSMDCKIALLKNGYSLNLKNNKFYLKDNENRIIENVDSVVKNVCTSENKIDEPSVDTLSPANSAKKPSWEPYFADACKQTMTDYAKKSGIDPQQYIDQNQAWLQQCVQHYMNENTTNKKSP